MNQRQDAFKKHSSIAGQKQDKLLLHTVSRCQLLLHTRHQRQVSNGQFIVHETKAQLAQSWALGIGIKLIKALLA